MNEQEQNLLDLFNQLSEQDAHNLLRFAEFLANAGPNTISDSASNSEQPIPASQEAASEIPKPEKIERPEKERVVDALKRLSATYPMLETKTLLDKASELVAQHVMFGSPAPQTIDKIETLFVEAYDKFVAEAKRN